MSLTEITSKENHGSFLLPTPFIFNLVPEPPSPQLLVPGNRDVGTRP